MFNINNSTSAPSLSQVRYNKIEQNSEEEFTLKDKEVLSGNSVWTLGHKHISIALILQKYEMIQWKFEVFTFKQMAEIVNANYRVYCYTFKHETYLIELDITWEESPSPKNYCDLRRKI